MANAATIEIAREIRQTLAGSALTARQAKLYSQRLRLDMGRQGLATFSSGDVDNYLDEAMLLLQCGLIEERADPASGWRIGIKRAAEILEWLSQSSLKPPGAPLHFLAAAAYQLAGYPAMALGHLRHAENNQSGSVLLSTFLRANFPDTLEAIRRFWRNHRTSQVKSRSDSADLMTYTFQHVVMCLGTVCTYLRTGSDAKPERALAKLDGLAATFLHSRDPYSYLLAQLTAASCRRFVEACLWPRIDRLREVSSDAASAALAQFARSAFANRRALVWPAQEAGMERLLTNSSFVLCTPTGSGKTTVATLGVIQGLFSEPPGGRFGAAVLPTDNMVLYLVPSRALAAEVEGRLGQDLKGIAAQPVVVTGLYGGVDWGPTDAWIQTDRATIVICTFEKADALLRYLGVHFLRRVRLVIVDEAHMVEQDHARLGGLEDGSSRPFRLEQLGARLLRAQDDHGFRVVALSAVAARAAPALARWISGAPDASPVTSSYRSTRQMLGHLEVGMAGNYTIWYDLMDGRSMKFDDEQGADTPFVPSPFPALPGGINGADGPDVRMRGPTLWAALQLAAERPDGSKPSVLISVTQNIEGFSATCVELIESWPVNTLPNYQAVDENDDLWVRCLASAADYFTEQSVEYRLLCRGIAVHHGKMPGLLARRLKTAIDRGFVRVIIATSTLSEGVNIPVNYLLIPSVYRGKDLMSLHEFNNLIGRAGRPGVATEGSALVVLPERAGRDRKLSRQWNGYKQLVAQIEDTIAAAGKDTPADEASSPLAHLLRALESAWKDLAGGGAPAEFDTWLEQTAIRLTAQELAPAYKYLDSLDAFLIAALQEVEELRQVELDPVQVEAELSAIWRRTYAFAAHQDETRMAGIWLARGRAIKAVYPDAAQRRRIYRTSLSPYSAIRLIELAAEVRAALQGGADYAHWTVEQRFNFICSVFDLLSQVPSFQIATQLGRRKKFQDWPQLLRWWLAKPTLPDQPESKDITSWYDFVAKNFVYRGAWGLGSVISLLLDSVEGEQPIRALEIADWPRSGLPWIAFWIKELVTWGTLDPVAAFLLARGDAKDRPQAEKKALTYYENLPADTDANDALDPRQIRDWVEAFDMQPAVTAGNPNFEVSVMLSRPSGEHRAPHVAVLPLETDDGLSWLDPAGYEVARCAKPREWTEQPLSYVYDLDVANARIMATPYQKHIK